MAGPDLETARRPACVRVGESTAADAQEAAREAVAALGPAEWCFVLAWIPSGLDCDTLAGALDASLGGVPVFGCTTAGQITTSGYSNETLLLVAFGKEHFRVSSTLIALQKPLSIPSIVQQVSRHNTQFTRTGGWNRLALVFADGLSKQEDLLASVLESVLEDICVFGGSAGDGLRFERTRVLRDGRFHDNAALLLLIETDLHYQGVNFDHFMPSGVQLVVTEANTEERLVHEINGAPAASEYARLVGCKVEDLSPEVFAENPMLVCHKMKHYVRSVNDATPTQSLSFLAAIDDGLVMALGRGKAVLETLEAELDIHDSAGREPDFILAFECVLRRLDIEQKQLARQVSNVFCRHRVLGFNTYGEQHRGLHMNQTFVGVAFFEGERGCLQ